MKKYIRIYPLLLLAIFCTSCNGQIKKDLPKGNEAKAVGQPKLVSPQGSPVGENVHCSLEDQGGNLWFGTTSEGLYKYDGQSFTKFTVTDGLHSNMIWSVFEDKVGRIWVGTGAGLNCYDPSSEQTGGKTFSKIRIASPNDPPFNRYDVFSILQDRTGKLWFATINGVYVYDDQSFTPFKVNDIGRGFSNPTRNNVENMLEDNAGNIWFGGRVNDEVFRYDPSAKAAGRKSITNIKLKGQKSHNWAWPVLQDKNGNIWFNNWDGAYRYDPSAKEDGRQAFTSFTKKDGLASDVIVRIIEDKNGFLWFGCGGEGLCRYDPSAVRANGKSFTCFTTKDGLINNGVWTILEDKVGNIWIGTNNTGLSRYNPSSEQTGEETFTSFSEKKVVFQLNSNSF